MSNELDRHIGEKLGNYESAVDTDALWQAVQPPRRRRPWGWLLLLLLIGAGTGFWLTWESDSSAEVITATAESNTSSTSRSSISTSVADEKKMSSEKERNNLPLSASSSLPVEEATAVDLRSTVEPENVADLSAKKAGRLENTPMTKAKEELGSAKTISLNTEQQLENQLVIESGQTSKDDLSAFPAEKLEKDVEVLEASNSSTPLPTTNPGFNKNETGGFVKPVAEPLAPIAKLAFDLSYLHSLPESNHIPPVDLLKGAPPGRKKQQWFAQMDAAYLFPQRELSAGAVPDSTTLVSDRASREEVLEGISVDLSVGVRRKVGWQLRAGLGYTQINILFSNSVTTQTVDTLDGLQMLVYGPDNSVDSIFGPVPFYETTLREKQTYNSFRQWEVPVLAGYNFELGAVELLIEGGLRMQLNRSWEGEVLYGEEGLQDLASKDWYRSGLALSLQGGLQLAYPISDKLDVLAGGSVRYSLQDFSRDTAPFKERYQLLGGQVSLRYKF